MGDFDGDGLTDLAVYGYSALNGYSRFGILFSSGRPTMMIPFGGGDDLPVAGEFDGDGIIDIAVSGFSVLNGYSRFAILSSAGTPARAEPFGAMGSIGLPAFPGLYSLPGLPLVSGSLTVAAQRSSPSSSFDEPGPDPIGSTFRPWRNLQRRAWLLALGLLDRATGSAQA